MAWFFFLSSVINTLLKVRYHYKKNKIEVKKRIKAQLTNAHSEPIKKIKNPENVKNNYLPYSGDHDLKDIFFR